MVTVDEFYKLARACHARVPERVTDEIIREAMDSLDEVWVTRLEAAKDVPREKWPTLVVPGLYGEDKLKPTQVTAGVKRAFARLYRAVMDIAMEKRDVPLKLPCPYCGGLLAVRFQKVIGQA